MQSLRGAGARNLISQFQKAKVGYPFETRRYNLSVYVFLYKINSKKSYFAQLVKFVTIRKNEANVSTESLDNLMCNRSAAGDEN